jgi:hypothetical protein
MARKVRYLAEPAAWLPHAKLADGVISPYLYPIEKFVQQQMKTDLSLPKIALAASST